MSTHAIFLLTLASALGSGLIAGVFFAFSSFVMAALGRLPADEGIKAMQSINVAVINRWFFVPFFATAALCVVLGVNWFWTRLEPGAACRLAGSLLYLLGTIGVTIGFNVPRNEALAAAIPPSASGAEFWAEYLKSWTAWNHVRTVAALAAAAMFTLALARG